MPLVAPYFSLPPQRSRALEFGIYRDGDNNLDASQAEALAQARAVSACDSSIQFTVVDTGSRSFDFARSARYAQDDRVVTPHRLATLSAKQAWIELVDHGAGDGGGLRSDSFTGIMPMPQIAAAIVEGVRLHAQAHPEDVNRNVDGIVANQCLMASMGFADALSRAGVTWLAARAETRNYSLPERFSRTAVPPRLPWGGLGD
jgi:hypothetical protein